MMRILHVIAQLPMKTGSGVYASNLIEGLATLGHQNAAIFGLQEPFQSPYGAAIRQFPVCFQTEELPFPIVGMSDDMPYKAMRYGDLKEEEHTLWQKAFVKQLTQAKEQFCPDIVISHHLWLLTRLVADFFNDIPVIGVCHATDLRQAQKNFQLKVQYANDFSDLAQVIALSQESIPLLKAAFNVKPDQVQVIPGGFNSQVFYEKRSEAKSTGEVTILYGGKISKAKGIFELAKAFKTVAAHFPKANLYLIGPASARDQEQLQHLAGGSRHLHFHPAVEQATFAQYLRETDLFVLPSYYEGVPLVAIEALASGARVVTTAIPGLMEMLGNELNQSSLIEYVQLPRLIGADVPHPDDLPAYVNRLTEAISRQLERIEANEAVSVSLKAAIQTHSWPARIRRFEQIVQQLGH